MWTVHVGLTVEIELRFCNVLLWTVGLTVEITLRFRDGLGVGGTSNRSIKAVFS